MKELFKQIRRVFDQILIEADGFYYSPSQIERLIREEQIKISRYLNNQEDIEKSALAISLYRLSSSCVSKNDSIRSKAIARQISEYAKVCTGIEINPHATIEENVVFIPGHNTVIGETSVIRKGSVIDAGVILGALEVGFERASRQFTRRHPTIGSGCHIGKFAQIFGPIELQDDTWIDEYEVVVFREELEKATVGVL